MREIKFRAWDKVEKKMLFDADPFAFHVSGSNEPLLAETHRNENCIFEQFTGLRDKNGKEIYEGDIVKVLGSCSSVYQCDSGEWVLPYFYKDDDPISSLIFHCDKEQIEVVGNIHENGELLEQEDARC